MFHAFLVGIGGFFGAVARFALSRWMNKPHYFHFPIGTLTVNLLGSFLLGLIIGGQFGNTISLGLGTGFMGAFTTFSTFKLENIQLHLEKKWPIMVTYLAISYIGGILLAFLGMVIVM
ncbi:fluoride efflux transporter CrcB [Virgibacillus halophilus]|uniref:fluoride efflux transporter CrcB n=1 Tax=Tigheibacillus halophilus TaxID=361280 RepID=UPI003638A2DE